MSAEASGAGAVRRATPDLRVRELGPADLDRAISLASETFSRHAFYRSALGLEPAAFDAYWEEFLPLALYDPSARLFGLDVEGRLSGLLLVGTRGFPSPLRAGTFLFRLLRRVGPRPWFRYLRFALAYEKVLSRPRAERRREARGLWLLVSPDAEGVGRGSALLRASRERMAAEGKTLITGLMDAGDPRLRTFYRRLGFELSPPFPFFGRTAACIVQVVSPEGGAPC